MKVKKLKTKNLAIYFAVVALVVASFSYGKYLGDEGNDLQDVLAQPTAEDQQIDAEIAAEDASAKNVMATANGFEPSTIKVKVGEKVTWINDSGDDVVPVFPPFQLEESIDEADDEDVQGDVSDNDYWELGFTQPGTYEYHDGLHPERKGTVVVE
jgi:plastocyanin